MKTITFYSYKGGVGRTLAATNFAVYLAKLGLKVAIMDFDLDAPGVDSKFPNFELVNGQMGLIDYILKFQRDGEDPGSVNQIVCSLPISSPRQKYYLELIPAGDYLASDYSAKLNELDWRVIFSENRDGVAFFQIFLDRINKELSPDVLIIDSRTGFSEIGGLCTQQLADETVIMTSLAKESIKMTRHLSNIIRESPIAKELNKKVKTKVVITRLPKRKNIDRYKSFFSKQFSIKESDLFFLFSCSGLEQEEFLAMLDTSKEDTLVANYIQLFQGLDVKIAQENICREIARTEQGILSCPSEEAETRIRELAALYPHSEVYRRAMRFFELRRSPEEAIPFGMRLLDLVPDDVEAQLNIARFFLHSDFNFHRGFLGRVNRNMEKIDPERLLSISYRAYTTGQLTIFEKIRLADLLEDFDDHLKSYEIAKNSLDEDFEDFDLRVKAMGIAARSAMKLGKTDDAAKIVFSIPVNRLSGSLASIAIRLRIESGDKDTAFEIAKNILAKNTNPGIMLTIIELAMELGRQSELVEAIRANPEFEEMALQNPEIIRELERYGIEMPELREKSISARRLRHRL